MGTHRARKRFGQHFLTDPGVIDAIVRSIHPANQDEIVEIGRRHGLQAVSWGHAGDGNMHANFLVDLTDADEMARAEAAAEEGFELAVSLRGSISGEHGLGWLKRGQLERQWAPAAVALHDGIKQAFDPKNLLNPGKKR